MFYHVTILSKNREGIRGRYYYLHDEESQEKLEMEVVKPFLESEEFYFQGCYLCKDDIAEIKIYSTVISYDEVKQIAEQEGYSAKEAGKYFTNERKDISREVLSKYKNSDKQHLEPKNISQANSRKIFIVHGHDNGAKEELAGFLIGIKFEPIILHKQASGGNTIIEKIEEYSTVGFGVVLYTACDKGAANADVDKGLNNRARQNVVFEHGYLIGNLGRKRVCALVKGDIEKPGDISGVVYETLDEDGGWKLKLVKELEKAGFEVDRKLMI